VAIRLTESRLRQIIREEARNILRRKGSPLREGAGVLREYEEYLVRRGNETYLGNDEGAEEEYYDDDPESHGLESDGDTVPYERNSWNSPLRGRQRRWTSY